MVVVGFVTSFIIFCVLLVIVLIAVFWRDIEKTLYPYKFVKCYFINHDNSIDVYFHKKTQLSNFEYKDSRYFLVNKPAVVYGDKKFKVHYYISGNAVPIDLQNRETEGIKAKLINDIWELKASDLHKDQSRSLDDFMAKYGIYIGIGVIILVVLYLLFGNKTGG